MTQKLADKVAAIESLLSFIFAHLDHIPCAARTARQGWISERSPLDDPPTPPPTHSLECSGRCWTCAAYHQSIGRRPQCPPDEFWIRERERLYVCYRIADIEDSVMRLAEYDATMAQAVWAVYVESWPGALVNPKRPAMGTKTEAIGAEARNHRALCAEEGLRWLAGDIAGDVRGYGETQPKVRPAPTDRDTRIVQMRIEGASYGKIVRAVGCSKSTVKAVLSGQRVHRGRTVAAGGA